MRIFRGAPPTPALLLNIIHFARAIYIAMRFLNLAQSEPDEPDYTSEPEK